MRLISALKYMFLFLVAFYTAAQSRRKDASGLVVFGVFADDAKIDELRAKAVSLIEKSEAIFNKADEEGRDLTDKELAETETINKEFTKIEAQINARIVNSQRQNSQGRILKPGTVNNAGGTAHELKPGAKFVTDPAAVGRGHFNHFGEFALAVKNALDPSLRQVDERLFAPKNAQFSGSHSSEGVGEDGGFVVPPDFRKEIWNKVNAEDSLLSRCNQLPTASNSITVPQNNIAPWDNSNGIAAYWDGEADQLQKSKAKLATKNQRLDRLTALIPVTDELLEDGILMDAYIKQEAPRKMDFKVSRAILAGTGAGMPLGIFNAPSTVTVAKESAQTAATILSANINKMWARLYSGCMKNAVWVANQDIMPQLDALGFPTSATAVPMYLPPGGLSAAPYGTLKGRPIIYTEACETLGTAGDLALVDFSQYLAATKAGGVKSDVSMHLYFDYNMTAFRFAFRIGGSPWWKSAITPRSGSSNTLGSAVILATRA